MKNDGERASGAGKGKGYRALKPRYSAWGRRRRLLRWGAGLVVAGVGAAVGLDHAGCFGYRGADWGRFDGRVFRCIGASDGGIVIEGGTEVALAGVDARGREGDVKSYLARSVLGKSVTLKIEPLQTRDARGHLLAYVYLADEECVNLEVVRAGLAAADRGGGKWMMRAAIDGAEAEAQRHQRGMWKGVAAARPAARAFHPD